MQAASAENIDMRKSEMDEYKRQNGSQSLWFFSSRHHELLNPETRHAKEPSSAALGAGLPAATSLEIHKTVTVPVLRPEYFDTCPLTDGSETSAALIDCPSIR